MAVALTSQNVVAPHQLPITTRSDQLPIVMTNFLEVAITAARQAGAIVREGYGEAVHVTHKGAIDLVTETDKRSEAAILSPLRGAFPGPSINSEETGKAAGDAYEWLTDPLAGATHFS